MKQKTPRQIANEVVVKYNTGHFTEGKMPDLIVEAIKKDRLNQSEIRGMLEASLLELANICDEFKEPEPDGKVHDPECPVCLSVENARRVLALAKEHAHA